jgi:hypothetical protein
MERLSKRARRGWREISRVGRRRRFLDVNGSVWVETKKTAATHRVIISWGLGDMFIRPARGRERGVVGDGGWRWTEG